MPLNGKGTAAYHRLMERQAGGYQAVDQYSHRTFYWFWNKVVRDAGKGDPHFVFHVCRHTAATRLANDAKVNTFSTMISATRANAPLLVHMKAQSALDAVAAI